ncbi:hypothetical protein MBLNU230_g8518t1 [Neophaeotheca triangularis]
MNRNEANQLPPAPDEEANREAQKKKDSLAYHTGSSAPATPQEERSDTAAGPSGLASGLEASGFEAPGTGAEAEEAKVPAFRLGEGDGDEGFVVERDMALNRVGSVVVEGLGLDVVTGLGVIDRGLGVWDGRFGDRVEGTASQEGVEVEATRRSAGFDGLDELDRVTTSWYGEVDVAGVDALARGFAGLGREGDEEGGDAVLTEADLWAVAARDQALSDLRRAGSVVLAQRQRSSAISPFGSVAGLEYRSEEGGRDPTMPQFRLGSLIESATTGDELRAAVEEHPWMNVDSDDEATSAVREGAETLRNDARAARDAA